MIGQERRAHPRITVEYKYFASSGDTFFAGTTHDISLMGIKLFTDEKLEPERQVDIRLFVPDLGFQISVKGKVVYCIDNPHRSVQPDRYIMGLSFTEGPLEELSSLDHHKQHGHYTPSHTLAMNAPAKNAYRLLGVFERYPEWATGIKEVRVRDRYPDGRGKRVEFQYNIIFRKVRYVLDYIYDDEKNVLSWMSAGGDEDILNIFGSYSFEPKGDRACFATYQLDVKVAFTLSKHLVQYVTGILMRREMQNFRKFAESSL